MSSLPLTNSPAETFSVVIFSVVYNMRQVWNTLGFWTLDILDEDGVALTYGVRLVTRTNLLDQYPNIPFNLRSEAVSDPARNNLREFGLIVTDKDA